MSERIELVKNTISNEDIDHLINWLKTYPHMSQGPVVSQFEEEFSKWQQCKYSVLVNSGSSSNMLMAYFLKISGELKNNKVILPNLSWATTISPFLQFGYQPYLCEVDKETLGCDLNHLEDLFKKYNPSLFMPVNVLGFSNKFDEIKLLLEKYNVKMIEDNCEATGSIYKGIKTGNFGMMSSFSGFIAHHFSLVEAGIICTDDENVMENLKLLRNHGFTRSNSEKFKNACKKEYQIDDFNEQFSFYVPGFNVRCSDWQSIIGLQQLKRLDNFCIQREKNFNLYQALIVNDYWKPKPVDDFVSNFAYPIIHPKRSELIKKLNEFNIGVRPLLAGAISRQPFWTDIYGKSKMEFADIVHDFGCYIPNNPSLTEEQIKYISLVVNETIN